MERICLNIIEKIKNVVLVVLIFTTILLLYFLWGNPSLEDFMFLDEDTHHKKISAEDVMVPKEVVICMGNDNYTMGQKDITSILSVFRTFSKEKNLLVEEITKDKYQAVMKYPSIRANYGYNIDFKGFYERYGIDKSLGFDNISTLTEIGFSKGSPASAFIYDGEKKKYFRLVGNDSKNNFKTFEMLTDAVEKAIYYPLHIYLGEESSNGTLIPVELPTVFESIPYEKDYEMEQKDAISMFVQTFFGKSSDFVRKVEESNGTEIYMYGYGEKVLIISPDGTIEYKEEMKNNNSEQLSFFDALDTSLIFVTKHEGFKTVSGEEIKASLTKATTLSGEKKGFRFVFSFSVDGNKLYYAEKNPLTIEVVNGQVTYFRRNLISVNEEDIKEKTKSEKEAVSAINMLALNFEDVKNTLIKQGIIEKEQQNEIFFEQVANRIDGLSIGYYKPPADSESAQLIPAWIVEVDGIRLYMDLYEADWLGYSTEYN